MKIYNVYFDGDFQFTEAMDDDMQTEADAAGYTLIEVDEQGKEIKQDW